MKKMKQALTTFLSKISLQIEVKKTVFYLGQWMPIKGTIIYLPAFFTFKILM